MLSLRKVAKTPSPLKDPPFITTRGEYISITKACDEWPGWFWCVNSAGIGGWVHESLFDKTGKAAVMLEDYNSTEIDAEVGEELKILRELGGWAWVKKGEKYGWIPLDCFPPDKPGRV